MSVSVRVEPRAMTAKKRHNPSAPAADTFRTLAGPCAGETVVERSRFIACARRTDTRADSQSFLKEIGAEHSGATHVCWAYRVGWPDRPEEHWSDAGEPSGTAGRPIHSALLQADLRNLTAIVVRYFGGTKLGVRGLIAAYGDAARAALDAGKAMECQPMVDMPLRMPYGLYQTVRHHVADLGGEIAQPAFGDTVQCVARIPRRAAAEFAALAQSWGVQTENLNNMHDRPSNQVKMKATLRERSASEPRRMRQS